MTERAIVFVGPMGSGKTSIGKKVSRVLGATFTDTDAEIVREHGAIADIFANEGEPRFREIERLAVQNALGKGGVVAVGGGAVLHAATQEDLENHHVVLLNVEPRVVAARISGGARPLVAGDDAMAKWQRIRDERWPVYQRVADVTFDTSRGKISAIVNDIASWVKEQNGE